MVANNNCVLLQALAPHNHKPSSEHGGNETESHHDHGSHDSDEERERNVIWLGLTSVGGIFLFFIVERLVGLYSDWRRLRKDRKAKPVSGRHLSLGKKALCIALASIGGAGGRDPPDFGMGVVGCPCDIISHDVQEYEMRTLSKVVDRKSVV